MRSFLTVYTDVLKEEQSIPELPSDKLIGFTHQGTPVKSELSGSTALKIARLQTMCVLEERRGEMPELVDEKAIAAVTGLSVHAVRAQSLGVSEDSTKRVMFLERAIVEIVRDAVPAEAERFGVRYFVHASLVLMHRPEPHQRFLD